MSGCWTSEICQPDFVRAQAILTHQQQQQHWIASSLPIPNINFLSCPWQINCILLHFWTRFNPANCHAECPTPASLINLSQFGLVMAIPRAPEAAIPATGPAIPSLPSHFALGHLQSQKAERSFEERLSLVFRLLHHPMALLVPRSPLLVQHNDRPLVSATVAINCPAAPKNMFPPPRPLQNAPKGESNPPATEEMVRSPDCLRPLAAPPSPRALCPKKA